MARLARVTDPDKLAASDGTRAQLRIEVPHAWLEGGAELEVSAPKRLKCDRCEGGGCDSCDRGGVFRAPKDPEVRKLQVTLPAGGGEAVQLRLVDPFQDGEITQLMLQVHPAEQASPEVTRLTRALATPARGRGRLILAAVVVALILLAIVMGR